MFKILLFSDIIFRVGLAVSLCEVSPVRTFSHFIYPVHFAHILLFGESVYGRRFVEYPAFI